MASNSSSSSGEALKLNAQRAQSKAPKNSDNIDGEEKFDEMKEQTELFSMLKENEKGFAIAKKTILYTGTLTKDGKLEDKQQVGYDETITVYKEVKIIKKRKLDASIERYINHKKPKTNPPKKDQPSSSAAKSLNPDFDPEFVDAASTLQSITKGS